MKKQLLFNPGPTNVSNNVRNAIRTKDICHREKEFSDVFFRVNKNILKIANGEKTHAAIPFVSSATGCNEAVISSIRGKVLLIVNGKYSERLKEIIKRHRISFTEIKINPYSEIDLKTIKEKLEKDKNITHIVMVHHETTTGMVLPLRKIGEIAKKYNKLLIVDTVSSFGGYKIDVKKDNLSFCTVSANKCLESFPGISFVIAKKLELEKIKGKSKTFYFDLYNQWQSGEKGETPFTPAVQLFFALDKALNELIKEGLKERIKRYERNNKIMREGLKSLGFKFLLPEKFRSNIVISLCLPKNMNYWEVHGKLKEKGYTIYSGQKTLDEGIFRIATLGNLKESDIKAFLKDFGEILKNVGLEPKKIKY